VTSFHRDHEEETNELEEPAPFNDFFPLPRELKKAASRAVEARPVHNQFNQSWSSRLIELKLWSRLID
jgi:hypothetical protein